MPVCVPLPVLHSRLCSPDLAHPDHPALKIQVLENARIAETRDGSYLDVTVQNHLPCVSGRRRVIRYGANNTLANSCR